MGTPLFSYFYKTGGLNLEVILLSGGLTLDCSSGSYTFLSDKVTQEEVDFRILYFIENELELFESKPVFTGESFEVNTVPYKWKVYEKDDMLLILIEMGEGASVNRSVVKFNIKRKEIEVKLQLSYDSNEISFDPFFQPLGSILLHYLIQSKQGIMIHASGVKDDEKGYVFTAVSGTGKSTMVGLWQKTGAQVINDDRLILIPKEGKVIMTNTPMPYYQDIYKESTVSAIFLIKQSPENYLKQVPGVAGVAGLMANCIQFLYNKEMVHKHLKAITEITHKCPVYELGFKPTTEITEIIRSEFGRKK